MPLHPMELAVSLVDCVHKPLCPLQPISIKTMPNLIQLSLMETTKPKLFKTTAFAKLARTVNQTESVREDETHPHFIIYNDDI
jgi:hypothetical protein